MNSSYQPVSAFPSGVIESTGGVYQESPMSYATRESNDKPLLEWHNAKRKGVLFAYAFSSVPNLLYVLDYKGPQEVIASCGVAGKLTLCTSYQTSGEFPEKELTRKLCTLASPEEVCVLCHNDSLDVLVRYAEAKEKNLIARFSDLKTDYSRFTAIEDLNNVAL